MTTVMQLRLQMPMALASAEHSLSAGLFSSLYRSEKWGYLGHYCGKKLNKEKQETKSGDIIKKSVILYTLFAPYAKSVLHIRLSLYYGMRLFKSSAGDLE